MTDAAEIYAAHADAVAAQAARLYGPPDQRDIWSGPAAAQFRFDPHRELDANLAIIASYLEPGDVLVDVGGGAGRVALPLALRCRETVNVEPSPGMGAEFTSLAAESGITNARLVPSEWLTGDVIPGDVVTTSDVTYFVRDIVPFLERMEAAARRRVMITVWSEPPPNRNAGLFRLIYGEEQAPMCGYRQLLPVLWEMGVLPDVRLMPDESWWEVWSVPSKCEAVEFALAGRWLREEDRERARMLFETRFDQFFDQTADGFRPLWRTRMKELLITWECRPSD